MSGEGGVVVLRGAEAPSEPASGAIVDVSVFVFVVDGNGDGDGRRRGMCE